jgi:hypothetical protein
VDAQAAAARPAYAYDVARAKRLLAAAGHANGLDVELWVGQDPTFGRIAQSVQGYLQAVGVRAKLVQRDAPSVREAARAGRADLVVKDWFADYPDADAFLTPLLASQSRGVGGNLSFYAARASTRSSTSPAAPPTTPRAGGCRARPTRRRSPTRRWCTCSTTTSCTRYSRGSAASRCRWSSTASAGSG